MNLFLASTLSSSCSFFLTAELRPVLKLSVESANTGALPFKTVSSMNSICSLDSVPGAWCLMPAQYTT